MKRIIALLLCFSMLFSITASICFAKEFPDVDASYWAYEYINKLSDEGVINGYNDGSFMPQGTIKRSEFLKLVVALYLDEDDDLRELPSPFDHWAAPYVSYAQNQGIIDEGDYTLENIEEAITRVEMARIVANADIIMKSSTMKRPESLLTFIDIGTLGSMDVQLIEHCAASGLIKGYEDDTFKPDKTMTRAEAATMIYRLSGYGE